MNKLHVLWTTGEKEVAMKVIFPYLINAKANGDRKSTRLNSSH